MADEMYPMGEDSEDQGSPAKPSEKDPEENSALVDLSVFPEPPKPGDICKFKVLHVYEKEALIEYVSEKKEEGEMTSMKPADDQIDRMASENAGGGSY